MSKKQPSYVNRKHESRRAHEDKVRKRVIIGMSAVFGVIVLVLAWGLYDHFVRQPARPVATVNGEVIRVDEYQKLLQYRRWDYNRQIDQLTAQRMQFAGAGDEQAFLLQYIDQQIQQLEGALMTLSTSTVDDVIEYAIIRQEAAKRSIVVSDAELDEEMELLFGYDRNPPTPMPTEVITDTEAPTPMPTEAPMTYDEYQENSEEWYSVIEQQTVYDRGDFRAMFERTLLQDKVAEAIRAEGPTTADQIHVRHILVITEEEAQSVLDRLAAGEDFADLAAELSTDTSNNEDGGDLGWFSHGVMVDEFDSAAWALQPGEVSGIVETQFGFHIIEMVERDANHPLDENGLYQAQETYYQEWLAEHIASEGVVRSFSSTMVPTVIPTKPYTPQ